MVNTLVATAFFLPVALLASFLHLQQEGIQVRTVQQRLADKLSVHGLEMMRAATVSPRTSQQLNWFDLGRLGAGKSGDFKHWVQNEEAQTLQLFPETSLPL